MHLLLLVNPRSRAGAAARWIPAVREALETAGARVSCLEVAPSTPADVAKRAHDVDRVVALGGDGTFACVADGVLDSGRDVPLALLPAGLANNHAHGWGIPTIYDDLEGAVRRVFGEGRIHMDVGRLDGARFYDTVGFGFQASALVRREAIRHRAGLGGELGYAAGTVLELARQRTAAVTSVEVTVDDRTLRWDGVLDVVVSNSVWYGGRWILDSRAREDDGLLEVVAVRGWRDLVRHGLTRVGTADLQTRSLTLVFDRPVPSQVDGEIGPCRAAFSLDVLAGALTVVGA